MESDLVLRYCARMRTTSLRDYISDPARRADLIAALDTSYMTLWQVATGWRGRRVSAERAIAIEAATGGVVPRWRMRPDLWEPPATESEDAE